MSKIKVLYVIDHLGEGGIQFIIYEALKLIDRNKFDVQVVALVSPHKSFSLEEDIKKLGVKVSVLCRNKRCQGLVGGSGIYFGALERIIKFSIILPYLFMRLFFISRKQKPDIIHSFIFTYLLAAPVGRFNKIPVVYSMPALKAQCDHYSKLIFPLLKLTAPLISHFFTTLPTEELTDYLGVKRDRISICPGVINYNDVDKVARNENPIFDEFDIPRNAKIILGAGRFNSEKGHIFAIKTFEKIYTQHQNIYLIIIGDGELRMTLQEYIKNKGLEGRVFLPGFRKDQNLFFSAADIFLRTNIFEGNSGVLHWVMAYGNAIVAFDNKSPSEILEHKKTAFFVSFKNIEEMSEAVKYLLENQEYAKELGRNASLFIKNGANIQETIKTYEEIYLQYGQIK